MNFNYINYQLIANMSDFIFNEKEVEEFVLGFVNHLKINNYLKRIKFRKLDSLELAMYDNISKVLTISIDEIILDACELCEDDKDKTLFVNIMILHSLVHEIVHIYQAANLKRNATIFKIMRDEFRLFKFISRKEYNFYWSFFTCERDASFTATEYILYLLRYFVKNKKMFLYFLEDFENNLLNGYFINAKNRSPIQIINKRFIKNKLPKFTEFDIYNSLKYGLPVNILEYNNFKRKKRQIILDINNLK